MIRRSMLITALAFVVALIPIAAFAQVAEPGRSPRATANTVNGKIVSNGFSVVLVIGNTLAPGTSGGSASLDTLPTPVRKALDDLKDFLPYRSYELLDSQWSLGSNMTVSRLRGVDNKEYALRLESRPTPTGLFINQFLLTENLNDPLAAAAAETERRNNFLRWISTAVINTSFSMDVGETVVVGTSRLQGSRALIVLLTAVPRSSGTGDRSGAATTLR